MGGNAIEALPLQENPSGYAQMSGTLFPYEDKKID
jgi:hypothetical protein